MSLTQLELEFQWTWIAPKHWSQRLHLKSEVRFFCFQQGFYNSTRAWTLALKKTSSSGVVGSFYYETIQLHQRNSVLHQHTFKLYRSLWNPHGLFFFFRGREEAEKAAKATEKNLSKKASIPGGTAGLKGWFYRHGGWWSCEDVWSYKAASCNILDMVHDQAFA